MKKTVITLGIINGIIIGGMLFITMPLEAKGMMENGHLIGYSTMVVASSSIFIGIKNFRDKQQGGYIKFGKAFQVGILIALIASAIYAACWEIFLSTSGTNPQDFMEAWIKSKVADMQADGATAKEIQKFLKESQESTESYKNPLFRFAFSMFMESLPVGLIVTLISALILKKQPKQQNNI